MMDKINIKITGYPDAITVKCDNKKWLEITRNPIPFSLQSEYIVKESGHEDKKIYGINGTGDPYIKIITMVLEEFLHKKNKNNI